jgi:DNA invertase Pin-like site-specific DNA recombinase
MPSLVPAAQYLRMSNEHQSYSLENQAKAIQRYAELNGYEIMATFSDAGRSGVSLKGRPGLIRLLNDVMKGTCLFRAILVYDVSRWGRFQDCDEAAHYEFICKSANIPVHYCAERWEPESSQPQRNLRNMDSSKEDNLRMAYAE